MKRCTICQLEKDESLFSFKCKKTNKLHSNCKECQKIKSKNHYAINTQIYKNRATKNTISYRNRNKEFVDSYKENKGCYFCKESDPIVLDLHHTKDKYKNVSLLVNGSFSIENIEKEIEKCIVLCSNCHRKLHAGSIFL